MGMAIDYPRPEEWRIAYNVTPYDLDPDGRDDVWQYFRSAESVPPWDDAEHEELRKTAFGIISRYLTATNYPVLTPIHRRALSGHCMSDSNGTRSLFVNVVSDPGIVHADWIIELQHELRENWPYWRARIAYWEFGVKPEVCAPTDILIYPDAIFVGQRSQKMDWRAAIADWRQHFMTAHRNKHAVERRRLQWLEREVPRRLSELADKPFAVAAVFRDAVSSRDLIAVMLRGKYATWTVSKSMVPGDDSIGVWREYPVTKQGQIGCESEQWRDNLGIEMNVVQSAPSHELFVCRIENPATDKIKYIPEFSFSADESQIVSDEFLAQRESTLDQTTAQ
jgi:hypothetical protein